MHLWIENKREWRTFPLKMTSLFKVQCRFTFSLLPITTFAPPFLLIINSNIPLPPLPPPREKVIMSDRGWARFSECTKHNGVARWVGPGGACPVDVFWPNLSFQGSGANKEGHGSWWSMNVNYLATRRKELGPNQRMNPIQSTWRPISQPIGMFPKCRF